MNIKIFGELFFENINSENQILDHIIVCIYDLLKKHILTLIKTGNEEINVYNDIKILIFQCVNKRYLQLQNPSNIIRNYICDCISILIISGITHYWNNCIEELIDNAKNGINNNPELIYICLRAIADCNIIMNFMKNDDNNNNEEDYWDDTLNFGEIKKNEIKEILMSKSKMILDFINKIYSIINKFEENLKDRIIKAIIDLIIFLGKLDLNILTNNDISEILRELINQIININSSKFDKKQISSRIGILKNVAELLSTSFLRSQNSRLYEIQPKLETFESPIDCLKIINDNIDLQEKKGIEKWLNFFLNILEQYINGKNENSELLWPFAKIFSSFTENYIFLFFDLNNQTNSSVFYYLRFFISQKREISWMFFRTLENMMVYITDYFKFCSFTENQIKQFADYLMTILFLIIEKCAYPNLKENDFSQLKKEILFTCNELDWNEENNKNYKTEDEDNIQVDDIDIVEYRNSAEFAIEFIYSIFKNGFNSNAYELLLYQKLLSLINININAINQNELNIIKENVIKLDTILFTLKSCIKVLDEDSSPEIFKLINDYLFQFQNSLYIQNPQIFIDYLLVINKYSPFLIKDERNFQNIIAKLLTITEDNNKNQIFIDSCYIILSNICSSFKKNNIYLPYFNEFLKRYKILCGNCILDDTLMFQNLISSMFYSLGINDDPDNNDKYDDNNNNIQIISYVGEIIKPLMFKNIIDKVNDRLILKKCIIRAYILFKEIIYHIQKIVINTRKLIINEFISNLIDDFMNFNENSKSNENSIKIFNLFPDDIEIINHVLDLFIYNSNIIAEDCFSIFQKINNAFISLLKLNLNFYKIIDFLGCLYKFTLQKIHEEDKNYLDINKYILESSIFMIKISINYLNSQTNLNEETFDKINLLEEAIISIFQVIYIPEDNINVFNDIISIIKFMLDLIESFTKSKSEKITNRIISNSIKSISSLLNNNVLKIISKVLRSNLEGQSQANQNKQIQQKQREEFVVNILYKSFQLSKLNNFSDSSILALSELYYQIFFFDSNLFIQIFLQILISTQIFNNMDINNISSYYQIKLDFLEFTKDIISIIVNKKQIDCLTFYFNRLISKKI